MIQIPNSYKGPATVLLYSIENSSITIEKVMIVNGYYKNNFGFTNLNNEIISDNLEFDERFNIYEHVSDDGMTAYTQIIVLSLDHEDIDVVFPDKEEMLQGLSKRIVRIISLNRYEDDLQFFTKMFTHPLSLYKVWKEQGQDIDKAQDWILENI